MYEQIQKIRFGHDGRMAGDGWYVDEVRIDVPSRGECYIFSLHRWLDVKEGDGLIMIEVEPTRTDKKSKCEF